MEKNFKNQTAIVTGAGVGIGFEIARYLAQKGAAVVLNDVKAGLAEEAAEKITAEGGLCVPMSGNVADVDFLYEMVDKAVSEFGKLTIAIANAGITTFGDFFEYDRKSFNQLVSVNLQGSFFLAQAAATQMRKQDEGGRILFMSSVTGHQAHKYLAGYGMTKAGLEMLARSLVVELSPYKITINAIAPGATITERTLIDDPNYRETWSKISPTGRASTTLDIARAAAFLVDPTTEQITGQSLVIDGGWSCVSPSPYDAGSEEP